MKTSRIDARRKAGAYYKVQFLDRLSLSWKDVQKAFPEAAKAAKKARELVPFGADWRVMEIRPDGHRAPVEGLGG